MRFSLIIVAAVIAYAEARSEWTGWTPCFNSTTKNIADTVTCNWGITHRYRVCTDPADNSTWNCATTEAPCQQQPCFDQFASSTWTECDVDCGGGERFIMGEDEQGNTVNQTIDCHNHNCTKISEQCEPADIVILLDSSGSIGKHWPVLKQFVIDFIKALEIDSFHSRISVISYSYEVADVIDLGIDTNIDDLEDKIWNMEYKTGGTHTSVALNEMESQFALRHHINNTMIGLVISDGQSNIDRHQTIPSADSVKDDNVTIFGIGVGDFDLTELTGIISEPKNSTLFQTDDYTSLKKIINLIIEKICHPYVIKECTDCMIRDDAVCDAEQCDSWGHQYGTFNCSQLNFITNEMEYTEGICNRTCFETCEPVDCSRCDFTKGQVWRPDTVNCHMYYVCELLADKSYKHHHMTCGELYWDQEALTCTKTKTGDCTTGQVVTAAAVVDNGDKCPLTVYNGDDTKFWVLDVLSTVRSCPEGLFFNDEEMCACVRKQGVTVPRYGCDRDILLHFTYEDHYNDVGCQKALAEVYGDGMTLETDPIKGGVACFDGSSYLEVPFMRNWFHGRDTRAFSVEMQVKYGSSSSFTMLQGLVNNGDCVDTSTFQLTSFNIPMDSNDVYASVNTDTIGVSDTQSYSLGTGVWKTVSFVYDGATLRIFENGVPVYSVPVNGPLANTQNPMRIGTLCEVGSQVENYFTGCIADLKVWAKAIY